MMSAKADLALRVLGILKQGLFVPTHDALQLRYWARQEEAALPLAEVARLILNPEEKAESE